MPPLLTFRFPQSRAKDFKELLARCKHFDEFIVDGDRYELNIKSPNELLLNWADFMVLATRLPRLTGSSATFMGDDVIPFTPDFFYKIQDSLYYCYHKGYKSTSFRSQFCESDWGCKQLNSVLRYLPSDKWQSVRHWFRFGRFDNGKWAVDKGAIFEALCTEADLKRLAVCPVFSSQTIKQLVDKLPDFIELDHNWQILTRTEITQKGIEEVPYMIVPNYYEVEPNVEPFSDKIDFEIKSETINPMPRVEDSQNWTEEEMNRFLDGMGERI